VNTTRYWPWGEARRTAAQLPKLEQPLAFVRQAKPPRGFRDALATLEMDAATNRAVDEMWDELGL